MVTIIAEQFRHWLFEMVILYFTIVAAGTTLIVFAAWFGRIYWRFHLPKKVICPRTNFEENVNIDAFPAAINALFGRRSIHLIHCSAWKPQCDCDQECVAQLVR